MKPNPSRPTAVVTPKKIKGFRAWLATGDGVFYVKKELLNRMPFLKVDAAPKEETNRRNTNA